MNEQQFRELAADYAAHGFPIDVCSSGLFFGSHLDTEPCNRPAASLCFYQGCEGVSIFPVCRHHSADAAGLLAAMGRDVLTWLPVTTSRQQ